MEWNHVRSVPRLTSIVTPKNGSIWINPRLTSRVTELDGIRGLAILLIIILHYVVEPATQSPFTYLLRLSWSGVDLFLVLSGFLIGGILIDAKTTKHYYRTFYLRRLYRIAPLYLILMTIFVVGEYGTGPGAKPPLGDLFNDHIPFWAYPIFVQNIVMTLRHTYGPSWMGATWSLAVEEQFYLLLPFVVKQLSRKGLVGFAVGMIAAAPLCRTILGSHNGFALYTLLPCRADALGFGLLVAIACRNQRMWTWITSHRRSVYAAFTILGYGVAVWIVGDVPLGFTWMAAFYTSLIILVVVTPGPVERLIFNSWVLVRLGTVAYAVYLFHEGTLWLYHYTIFGTYPSLRNWSTVWVTLLSLVTVILLSSISWLIFEKPLVRLAHTRYKYQ